MLLMSRKLLTEQLNDLPPSERWVVSFVLRDKDETSVTFDVSSQLPEALDFLHEQTERIHHVEVVCVEDDEVTDVVLDEDVIPTPLIKERILSQIVLRTRPELVVIADFLDIPILREVGHGVTASPSSPRKEGKESIR